MIKMISHLLQKNTRKRSTTKINWRS